MLLAAQQPAAAASDKPLQIAIVNQVHFHLEVVAGAMHVCKEMTSAPVTVYLPAKVLKTNWYGFINWLGGREGFIWKEGKEYDGKTTYDLVWFITPERHIPWITTVSQQMQPKVAMYMVHNGHLPDSDFKALRTMSGKLPLLTLSPHVAKNITGKTGEVAPEWILPIFPYTPATECKLEDLQGGKNCLKGFSVQGRIEKSRRNYTQMWEQIGSYRKKEGAAALSNFRLNILGEVVEYFAVPADVRDLVAVYKNPPYPIFYDVVYHSYALVPMLASALYYSSKFSSTVLTSFITGVPIIADRKFMAAYSMIEPNAVFPQEDGRNELDIMFNVARMTPEEMWRTRLGLKELRGKMNTRAKDLILGWLKEKGLAPDAKSELGKAAAGHRRQRRTLLSPLWLLAEAFGQQREQAVMSAGQSWGL